jgi:Na+-transporting methylmalonyl-CoA/oxaloacetate decarboxylase gamma subunit
MENFGTSLWITLIGMGLVFVAIFLLWGLMALLVRITRDKPQTETNPGEIIDSSSNTIHTLKAKAAAVAVAAALAAATASSQEAAHPSADTVNTWHSANQNNGY